MNSLTLVIGNKNYSSWSLRAWLYLTINDIPFDEIRLPIGTTQYQNEISQYSPTRCVPALITNEGNLWDSLAIIEYVNRHFPTSVNWPKEKHLEALALSAVMEMHSGFTALRKHYPMNCRLTPFKAPLLEGAEREVARLDQLWTDLMDASQTQGPGLLGQLTIVDVVFAPVVFRCKTYGLPLSERSRNYMENMLNQPAMVSWAEAGAIEVETIDTCEFHYINGPHVAAT